MTQRSAASQAPFSMLVTLAIGVIVVQSIVLLAVSPMQRLGADFVSVYLDELFMQFSLLVAGAVWVVTSLVTAHVTNRQAAIDAEAPGGAQHAGRWKLINALAVIGVTGTLGTGVALFEAMLMTTYHPLSLDQPAALWVTVVLVMAAGPLAAIVALSWGTVHTLLDRSRRVSYDSDRADLPTSKLPTSNLHG